MTDRTDNLRAKIASYDYGAELCLHNAMAHIKRLEAENTKLHGWLESEAQNCGRLQRKLNVVEAENAALRATLRDLLSVSTLSPDERIKVRTTASKLLETPNGK